ncbi:MAG: trypsin-like serine protease [Ruminococcaceae bacterium]|nr:trypsin-like serine protease [Oscillospiraceae bacterium]
MKRLNKIFALALVLAAIFALSSCSVFDLSSKTASNTSAKGNYITKDEANKLIEGIEENVTVNAGDNINININSTDNQNALAASKGLLSTVSITANFTVTTVIPPTFFYPGSTETTPQTSRGSGVIYQIDKERGNAYIITNYHVIYSNGADTDNDISDDIKCYLYGQEYDKYAVNATFIGGSMAYDIAILKVTSSDVLRESKAVAAEFADSNNVSILDTAIAIGNPEGLGISATVGAVNVESEHITMRSLDGSGYISVRVMRIDTAVNGGNSGGGLYDGTGKLIGIVNAKITDSTVDNIGYAIPSNVAKYVADNIIYYDGVNASNDSVYRLLIGIEVDVKSAGVNYDAESGKVLKYEEVVVGKITEGGACDGKLAVGDVIKSVVVDGKSYSITRTFNVIDVMLTARQTSSVSFVIERNGTELEVSLDMSKIALTPA